MKWRRAAWRSQAQRLDTLVSILEKEPPPLDDDVPEVPTEFQRIINKALRKDREERYQTINDLLIDLKSFKEELSFAQKLERSRQSSPSVGTGTTPRRSGTTIKHSATGLRNRRVIALVLVVLASLLIIGAVLWRRGGPRT